MTKMVDEFTELQGRMGMEYAKHSGENEIVSTAIYEQYLPRFSGDELPTTTAGSILSIADKLDTISWLFCYWNSTNRFPRPLWIEKASLRDYKYNIR